MPVGNSTRFFGSFKLSEYGADNKRERMDSVNISKGDSPSSCVKLFTFSTNNIQH